MSPYCAHAYLTYKSLLSLAHHTHCKRGESKIETCFTKIISYILLSMIFAIVMEQYNLMVCVDLSLIGCDPTVSHQLAKSPSAIAVHLKSL